MDTGCFLTFEDLLLPVARKALRNRDEEVLARFGRFVEELMSSYVEYAVNLATISLQEGAKAERGRSICRYLGRISLEAYENFCF